MDSTVENSTFLMPHRVPKWYFYIFLFLGAGLVLTGAVIIFRIIMSYEEPILNYVLLAFGLFLVLATFVSYFEDMQNLLEKFGVRFTDEFLYLHRFLGRIKIPYKIIEEVVFYPPLIQRSSAQYGHQSWLRVRTETRNYWLKVPHSSLVEVELKKQGIPTRTDRSGMIIVVVTFIFLTILGIGILPGLGLLVLMLIGIFSKNSVLSRRTELLTVLSFPAIIVMVLSFLPISSADRDAYRLVNALKDYNYEFMANHCDSLQLQAAPTSALELCARYYITARKEDLRNYPKGLEFATAAHDGAKSKQGKLLATMTLACAHAGLGNFDKAIEVAQEYQLESTIQDFKNRKPCDDN